MKLNRKFLAVLLALCLTTLPCATAFAADVEADAASAPATTADGTMDAAGPNEPTEVTPRQSIGRLLAGGNNDFYGSGYIELYLSSGNSWADIQAGTGGSSCTGAVIISVKFPTGQWYELGTVKASADHTIYNEFTYCPAGTYLFYFENTTSDWIQVYANIYD